MANRSVTVRLKAEIAGYLSAMRSAKSATEELGESSQKSSKGAESGLARLTKVANDQRQSWDTVSSGLLKVGAVGVAGLGLVTKAAIDWESAWAGVTKVVTGTPQQLQHIEDGLRGMARELPATHEELAAVAQAAGQLGIATPDVLAFTRTMIDMGVATNLSADEAATTMARFANIMQSTAEHGSSAYSRIGSAIVDLGNNFATTEAEIFAMAMRLAGTGAQLNLTEGDVLGISAAMSSVGIEAEAGGTAMSMGLKKIDKAVRDSSSELSTFAEVSGMSMEEFKSSWGENAAGTLDQFVVGLARVSEEGGSVSAILDEVGIKGIREADTFLRLAGSSELLSEALERGNSAFEENSALAAEAAVRYETTESQVKMAMSSISDSMIDAGAVMLPVVSSIAQGISGLATGFSNLPAPVQGGITALGGIAAVSALVVGGGMKMVTMASDASEALTNLGVSGGKARGILGGIGKAAGVAAVAMGALAAASWAENLGKQSLTLSEISTKIRNTETGALDLSRAFEHMAGNTEDSALKVNDLDSAMNLVHGDSFRAKMARLGDAMPGISNDVTDAKESFEGIDATLSQLAASGSLDEAAEGFAQVAEWAEANGKSVEEVARTSFPAYMDALRGLGDSYDYPLEGAELMAAAAGKLPPGLIQAMEAADGSSTAMSGLGDAVVEGAFGLQEMADAAHEAELTLSDLFDAMFALGMVQLNAQAATGKFHESLRATKDAADEMAGAIRTANGEFDVTTEAGYAAQQAFAGVAQSGRDMAEATAEAGGTVGEITGNLDSMYNGLVTTAEGFGFTAEQAEALAREAMSIPDDVDIETWMSDEALRVAAFTGSAVKDIPAEVDILSWMSDSAFLEALRTKAAALDIPEHEAISTFMDDVARNKASDTTAAILGIPKGADVQSWMSDNAENTAWRTKSAIDAIPKDVNINITTRHLEIWDKTSVGSPKSTGPLRRSTGGRIPALADGGRLPSTGLGTDKILGISSMTGAPTAWVDDREWVVNQRSSDKYNALLSAVNRDDPKVRHLAGHANGGRVREYATGGQVAARTSVSASVDPSGIEAAVRSGLAGARVEFQVDKRTIHGIITDATHASQRR